MIKYKRLVLFITLLLSSCTSKPIEKFRLSPYFYTTVNAGLNYDINYKDDILVKATAKESFAVYVYSPGCSACGNFSPILQSYLSDKKIMMYAVTYASVKEEGGPLFKAARAYPYLSLFNEGLIITTLDPLNSKHTQYFTTTEHFGTWFETYVDISAN